MPVTRAQRQIDFPAKKSSNTRAKRTIEPVDVVVKSTTPRRKRGAKTEPPEKDAETMGSPPKVGKKSSTTIEKKQNVVKPCALISSVALNSNQPPSVHRMPLSPRQEPNNILKPSFYKSPGKNVNVSNVLKSPLRSPMGISLAILGEVSPFVTKKTISASPLSARACLFGDGSQKNLSPVKMMKNNAMQSPCSRMNIIKGLTPLKLRSPSKENCFPASPEKSARALTFDSPSKQQKNILNSPLRESRINYPNPRLLDSPIRQSPLKLDMIKQNPLRSPSPRKLLNSPLKLEPSVRMSPRKICSPFGLARQEGLCYQRAKRALHTALPERIVCREKEYAQVNGFLLGCLDKKKSGSMYISGAPGTGKTAVLSQTLKDVESGRKAQMIYVNCMSVKNSQAIFNKVLGEITGRDTNLSTKDASRQLEKSLTSKGSMICLVMDECDQLDSKNQEVLYTMFEWPHLTNSRLVLIGIANALDLTDRILPRLQAKPKCKPKIMNFAPYTKEQIVTIIKDRLSRVEVDGEQVLDPGAVVFCARKVSAVAGDMRKALDVCRRAVEMVENEVKKQRIINVTLSPSNRPAVPKKIGVAQIMKVMNEVYGSGVSVSSSQQATVPLQQKMALCTLLLTLQKGKAKEIALGKLHENYCKVCKKQEVPAVDQSEFMSLCTLIEARGIVSIKRSKESRLAKISLKLDEKELEQALQDKVLVSTVLRNGIPEK